MDVQYKESIEQAIKSYHLLKKMIIENITGSIYLAGEVLKIN